MDEFNFRCNLLLRPLLISVSCLVFEVAVTPLNPDVQYWSQTTWTKQVLIVKLPIS